MTEGKKEDVVTINVKKVFKDWYLSIKKTITVILVVSGLIFWYGALMIYTHHIDIEAYSMKDGEWKQAVSLVTKIEKSKNAKSKEE